MERVLVTGGAGFIGSHLVPRLAKAGHEVRILDTLSPQIHGTAAGTALDWLSKTPGVEFRLGSVTDPAALGSALEDVTTIIHLAAETGTGQSMYEIARYTQENVQGTAVLMQALADNREVSTRGAVHRVLLASSRSVYGEGAYVPVDDASGPRLVPPSRTAAALAAGAWEPVHPDTGNRLRAVPTREGDRTAPASIYAATKLAQEDLIRIACETAGTGYAILRLQNVYGEGQSLANPYTGILSIFSTRIRRGLELPIFEDGQETRDFVHVTDVAAAFEAALQKPEAPNSVINVGSGVATPVIEVARALSRAMEAPDRTRVTGQYRLGDIRHNHADITRLQEVLGLAPSVSLDEGLRRFSVWIMRQPLPEDRLGEANAQLVRRRMMG